MSALLAFCLLTGASLVKVAEIALPGLPEGVMRSDDSRTYVQIRKGDLRQVFVVDEVTHRIKQVASVTINPRSRTQFAIPKYLWVHRWIPNSNDNRESFYIDLETGKEMGRIVHTLRDLEWPAVPIGSMPESRLPADLYQLTDGSRIQLLLDTPNRRFGVGNRGPIEFEPGTWKVNSGSPPDMRIPQVPKDYLPNPLGGPYTVTHWDGSNRSVPHTQKFDEQGKPLSFPAHAVELSGGRYLSYVGTPVPKTAKPGWRPSLACFDPATLKLLWTLPGYVPADLAPSIGLRGAVRKNSRLGNWILAITAGSFVQDYRMGLVDGEDGRLVWSTSIQKSARIESISGNRMIQTALQPPRLEVWEVSER